MGSCAATRAREPGQDTQARREPRADPLLSHRNVPVRSRSPGDPPPRPPHGPVRHHGLPGGAPPRPRAGGHGDLAPGVGPRVGHGEAPVARGAGAPAGGPLRRGPLRRRRETRRPASPVGHARLADGRAPGPRGHARRGPRLPARGAHGAPRRGRRVAADIVATEARDLTRSLAALRDDKGRYALRRCLEAACRGEPYALDVEGRLEDLPAATPVALRALHRRLRPRPSSVPRRRRGPGAGEGARHAAPAVGGPRAPRGGRAARRVGPPRAPPRAASRRAGRGHAGQAGDRGARRCRPTTRVSPRRSCSRASSAARRSRGSSRSCASSTGLCYYAQAGWVKSEGSCSCSPASSRGTSPRRAA